MEKPVTIADLMDFSFYGNLKTKGSSVIFVQGSVSEEKDQYLYNLMQYDGHVRQLTSRDNTPAFVFQDEQTLLFTQPKEDKEGRPVGTSIWRLPLKGGEALPVGSVDKKGIRLAGMLAEDIVLFGCTEALLEEEAPDYEVLDELPWYGNALGFINKKRTHLYALHLQDGHVEPIAPGYSADMVQVRNGQVVFAGNPDRVSNSLYNGLYFWNFSTGQLTVLLAPETMGIRDLALLDSEVLFFASDYSRYGLNENACLYRCSLEEPSISLAARWDQALGNTVGTDCALVGGNALCVYDNTLYFTSTIVEHNTLFCYKDGAIHQVFAWSGTIHSFGFTPMGLYFIGAAPNELQQLWFVPHSQLESGEAICLSNFNPQLQDRYIAKAQPVFYTNYAGQEQMGWVLYPFHFDPARSYPGILDIHGGPKTVYGTIFYHEMQVWASRGYFVFFCNPVGSDGQGNEYADLRGRYGKDDYTDLMNFTDAVLQKIPQIDPARIGVTGGSYGGFMTNWIIGHTSRFAAAASQRSISNWISFAGTSDIGPMFCKDQQGCGLENIQQLWEHSPLKYVSGVTTPTLFIHSDEDYRCPLEQGMQMCAGILDQNKTARLVLFHKENHELSRSGKPSHRVRRLKEITDWMEKYAPATEE